MDAKALRIKNLRALIDEIGGVQELANAADTSYNTIWQILSGTPLPSGLPRALGHRLARKLEAAVGKPMGWLDLEHDDRPAASLEDDAIRFALWWQNLDERERAKFHQVRTLITEKAIPDSVVEQKMPIVLQPKDGKKGARSIKKSA